MLPGGHLKRVQQRNSCQRNDDKQLISTGDFCLEIPAKAGATSATQLRSHACPSAPSAPCVLRQLPSCSNLPCSAIPTFRHQGFHTSLFSEMSLGLTTRVKSGLTRLSELLSSWRRARSREEGVCHLTSPSCCSSWSVFRHSSPPPQPFTPASSSASLCLLHLTAQQLVQSTAAAR